MSLKTLRSKLIKSVVLLETIQCVAFELFEDNNPLVGQFQNPFGLERFHAIGDIQYLLEPL